MNYYIESIKKLIYAKRKQILFALFALLCLIDNDSSNIIKSAAPAVVAGAAKVAGAAGKVVTTGAKVVSTGAKVAGAGEKVVKTASDVKKGVDTAKEIGAANEMLKQKNSSTFNRRTPRNTNPKINKLNTHNNFSRPLTSAPLTSGNSMNTTLGGISATPDLINNDIGVEPKRKNYLMKPFVPSKGVEDTEEDDDENVIMENASKQVIKSTPALLIGLAFGGLLLFVCFIPMLFLGVVNASNTTLSQIDCTKQQGDNCEVDDSSDNFLNKLKNLFTYGAYGSNSEVVLKEFENSYDKIKEEYDFIISLPLLSSSMFSDSKYIETDVEDGKIVITEEMLERSKYIYDMAQLQMIPRYNIYTCEARLVDSLYNIYEYDATYQDTLVPTYDEGDTTEEDVASIPTGECNAFTAGGQFKKITYFFDEERYFKRLKDSEELDLVYSDFVDSDKLLVSKVSNQYYIYKQLYNVDEELSYLDVPVQLLDDEGVLLQAPLKGWYSITSPFGNREGEYAGMHTGIDLVSSDKNIYAAGKGVVTRSNVETEGGNVIEITHTDRSGREYVTQYAHLSVRGVNVGDIVNAGDAIGVMGDTGTMASGVHLHFAMWEKETKEYYNPRKLFNDADNY